MKPTLGKTDAGPLAIDVERLLETRALLTASSGWGKSWALRRLIEQTHGKAMQLVIDPEGEFASLREKFDFVIAGKGGDCPADPRAADLLARRLLELGTSAVLDLSELSMSRPRPGVAAPRVAFVRDFVSALVEAPRPLWRPALVVIDEAHMFCPEKGEAESANAVRDLMSRGRKRGFAGILATQRLSKLSKDAAAEAGNVLVGHFTLDLDLKRAADTLAGGKEIALEVRRLDRGEFFAFGPALSEDVVRVQVGDVATTHPKSGQRAVVPPAPRGTVLKALEQLRDLPAEAEQEARTAEELRAKLRGVERELAQQKRLMEDAVKRQVVPDPKAFDEARTLAYDAGAKGAEAAARRAIASLVASANAGRERAARALDQALAQIKLAADALREPIDVPEMTTEGHRTRQQVVREPSGRASSLGREPRLACGETEPGSDRRGTTGRLTGPPSSLDGPMQRILDAIAWLESAGLKPPFSREQVAFLANYTPKTGAFQNALGRLSSAGLVTYPSPGMVELTIEGIRAARARAPEAPGTAQELQKRVIERIDGPMRRCLEPLLRVHPRAMTREELAAAAGYQAGTGAFQNALGRLRTLGCIEYPDRGHAVARDWLFLK